MIYCLYTLSQQWNICRFSTTEIVVSIVLFLRIFWYCKLWHFSIMSEGPLEKVRDAKEGKFELNVVHEMYSGMSLCYTQQLT